MLFAVFCIFPEILWIIIFPIGPTKECRIYTFSHAPGNVVWVHASEWVQGRQKFSFEFCYDTKIVRKCTFCGNTGLPFRDLNYIFFKDYGIRLGLGSLCCCNDDVINVVLLLMSLRIWAWGFSFWYAWLNFSWLVLFAWIIGQMVFLLDGSIWLPLSMHCCRIHTWCVDPYKNWYITLGRNTSEEVAVAVICYL